MAAVGGCDGPLRPTAAADGVRRRRRLGGSISATTRSHWLPAIIVVLAAPSWVAADLVPDLEVPTEQGAIVNGHFRFEAPRDAPALLGVVGGTVEWIFVYPKRISVTISGADRLLEQTREDLAAVIWREIQTALQFEAPLPAWQVIKERRATFAASPAQDARRPMAVTDWRNLVLAGDFTAGELPATIEFAIRSGFRAADSSAKSGGR